MSNSTENIAKKLFKNDYITKIELENFLAEERAFEAIHNYNLEKIQKQEEIELKYLEVYKKQVEFYKNFLFKLSLLNKDKKDLLLKESTEKILQNIDVITNQIIKKFDKYISTTIKKQIGGMH